MNHLKIHVLASSSGDFEVQCECGEQLVRSVYCAVTDIDQAIASHRVTAAHAERTRKLSYDGPERRQARPLLHQTQPDPDMTRIIEALGVPEADSLHDVLEQIDKIKEPAPAVTCKTCGDTGDVHYRTGVDEYETDPCPDCNVPPLPAEPAPVVQTELEVRLARLERIVHRITSPLVVAGRVAAEPEKVKQVWAEAEQAAPTPTIGCRCAGPEHDQDCWKKYT